MDRKCWGGLTDPGDPRCCAGRPPTQLEEIAEERVLSERTLHRHLSNSLGKLGVSSRTAVVGFAYDHGFAGNGVGRNAHRGRGRIDPFIV